MAAVVLEQAADSPPHAPTRGQGGGAGADAALARIEQALTELPLPPGVSGELMAVLRCASLHGSVDDRLVPPERDCSDEVLLEAARSVRGVCAFAEGVAVTLGRTLADRAGRELLGRKGVSDPAELSPTARTHWRAKTKSVVAQELATLTGWSVQSCHARLGFGLAPRTAVAAAEAALTRGLTDWRAVSEWWSRCARMDPGRAGVVGEAVFGVLIDGGGLEGDLASDTADEATPPDADRGPRWERWPEFVRRLSREVTRVEGADAQDARRRRLAALARRTVWASVEDDGTGQLTVSGATASIVAASERIDTVARAARAGGDARPLRQIRSDTALALLVHGTVPLPERSVEAAAQCLIPVDDEIVRILRGMPIASVEVVVPTSMLLGAAADPGDRTSGTPAAATSPDHLPVAEIPGHGFLTPEQVREVVAAPGTTLHRLLTDPADGRLVERSTTAYRPDALMVRQVRAADRCCRAPGCLVPALRCELDHEQPFGTPGGVTAEPNLDAKHGWHHQLKTERLWSSAIDATRTVTWTTFFGRLYRTRGHDYRQYDQPPAEALTATDPELRDELVYAALASRTGAGDTWLEGADDHHTGTWLPGAHLPLDLFHRTTCGRRRGPPVGQPSVRQLLDRRARATSASQTSMTQQEQPPPPGAARDDPPPF